MAQEVTMADTVRNVFISHVHEDDALLQDLKTLLASKGYEVRDGSIDSSKPNDAQSEDYIKAEILAPHIRWAGAVIVLISPLTHSSKYVNWEIEYAARQDKPVIGVYALGGTDSNLPEAFQKYGDSLVGWQADRVIDALEGRLTNWRKPDGTGPVPERDISRFTC
jgi:hypothetical protein